MRGWLLAAALAAAPAAAQPGAVIVGAVMPETGQLADLAADMKKALVLWQETRNAAGGLLGRPIELRVLDDRSEASASMRLYTRLIEDERADLLIGPFGSAATVVAAATTERAGRVLVNATGVSGRVLRPQDRYVFHVPALLAAYGAGALAIARAAGYTKLQVLARSDSASREAADGLLEAAAAAGLDAVLQAVPAGTTDYAPQIAAARARNAEAWIAFGLPRDAAEMVKSFKRIGYAPWMFLAQGAADPGFLRLVGQDAELALGISAYEPSLASAANAAFVAEWRKRWSSDPGAVGAATYAAAMVAEAAAHAAGSLDQERLRAALAALELDTPLGPYRVGGGGAQLGVKPAVVQIVEGRRRVVWPPSLATAKWRLPYPRWDERQVHAPQ
jgi:branched-chain amino acid transport system substrate-binding protein